MTLPASIRINAQFPFPSLVSSSGPITITKSNGIWTVGLQFTNLGAVPNGTAAANLEVLVYNTLSQTFQQTTVSSLLQLGGSTRTVTATGAQAVLLTDSVILISQSVPAPTTFTLPTSASRYGLGPYSFKDLLGTVNGNNVTIATTGGDTIDGQATFTLNDNFEAVTLYPLASGGYWIG
jgi:hypothetical protein